VYFLISGKRLRSAIQLCRLYTPLPQLDQHVLTSAGLTATRLTSPPSPAYGSDCPSDLQRPHVPLRSKTVVSPFKEPISLTVPRDLNHLPPPLSLPPPHWIVMPLRTPRTLTQQPGDCHAGARRVVGKLAILYITLFIFPFLSYLIFYLQPRRA